jgi:hypothetical protein
MTGWDWRNKRSIRIGYDFDALVGHAVGVGVSQDELNRVREAVEKIPQAWLFRSTGGNGLHLYLAFDPENAPKTTNHHEHAALARACLGVLSNLVNFNFEASLDVCGSNMWVWGRKMTPENQGLSLIKRGEGYFDPPDRWRDHIAVITRKRAKVQVTGAPEGEEENIENLAASRRVTPLDAMHRKIIDALQELNYSTHWIPDHNLLQTHTRALTEVAEKFAREGNPLAGHFLTISDGTDPGKPNCFAFPCPEGAFKVVRFGNKAVEDPSWCKDSKGWTYCYFNRALDLLFASKAYGGLEDESPTGGYMFPDARIALEAAKSLGSGFVVPDELAIYPTKLKTHRDGRVVVEIQVPKKDQTNLELEKKGWLPKGNKVTQILNVLATPAEFDEEKRTLDMSELDGMVRSLLTSNYEEAGWALFDSANNHWARRSKDNIKSALRARGYDKEKTEEALGLCVDHSWILVNIPFAPELPGNRQWNVDAAQFRYQPVPYIEDNPPQHPHWDLVLGHCGHDLDASIKEMPWARKNGVRDGKEYLQCWIASMLRHPFEPLPYLFFFGPQNSGKSILHEALSLLIADQKGVVHAERALTSPGDFNGELANAILCVVEETDLSISGSAVYNKIKDWVTSLTISIHAKRLQVYSQRNTTHWMQMANERSACPVFPGDTRITMAYVPLPDREIPKNRLISALEDEAPQFMSTLLALRLPEPEHRLRIPVVITSSKEQAEDSNRNVLEQFITENYFYSPGQFTYFNEFFEAFQASINRQEREHWNRRKVQQELPQCFLVGRYSSNKLCIGNISAEKPRGESVEKFVVKDQKLVLGRG